MPAAMDWPMPNGTAIAHGEKGSYNFAHSIEINPEIK
jgi:hypothetical protein